LVFTT